MKITKIMFPTDFSEAMSAAKDHALYLAETLGARVSILHAIEPLDSDGIDDEIRDFYEALEAKMGEKMTDEREAFEGRGIEVETDIIIGERWKVINNVASERGIDLIVIGSHGITTSTGEISVGTTSHKVMFTSPCPVLVVRHDMTHDAHDEE
ncbi:MAG: universal stress protein [Candidatus Dadabacteria bacterium]|nr:universal stress protein [Candidatus Dadabacteria bacterium]